MKVTRSQKLYLAALGVGVCAFVLDKAFAGAAPSARDLLAAITPTSLLADRSTATAPPADATIAAFDSTLATKLNALSQTAGAQASTRDGFTPSATWNIGPSQAAEPGERGRQFQQAHRLKAIVAGRHGQVMIDGNLVAVGQAIDGFTLLSVSRMRAAFSDGTDRVELTLDGSSGATPSPTTP